MALINRPFRGFSGTYTRPELPLEHPEITLQLPNELMPALTRSSTANTSAASASHSLAPPAQDAAPAPPASASAPKKPSHHLFTGLFHIFSGKHHAHSLPKRKRKRSKTAAQSCETRNMCDVVVHCAKDFSEQEKAQIRAELERLYMETYSKAERRKFFRDAKRREEMERMGCAYGGAECAVCDDDEVASVEAGSSSAAARPASVFTSSGSSCASSERSNTRRGEDVVQGAEGCHLGSSCASSERSAPRGEDGMKEDERRDSGQMASM